MKSAIYFGLLNSDIKIREHASKILYNCAKAGFDIGILANRIMGIIFNEKDSKIKENVVKSFNEFIRRCNNSKQLEKLGTYLQVRYVEWKGNRRIEDVEEVRNVISEIKNNIRSRVIRLKKN